MLTDEQRTAFAAIRAIWSDERIILIGAGALRLHKRLPRFTADLDIAVAVDLADYPGRLLATSSFQQEPRQPQRWVHDNGIAIDIILAGAALRAQGHLDWPNAHRMSLEGFEALFSAPLPFADEDLRVEIATVPIIVLLKMVAWLDRPAERTRDLQDLAFLLTDYLDEADDRDFDRILAAISDGNLDPPTAQAFLLGQDVALCHHATPITERFVHSLSTSYRGSLRVERLPLARQTDERSRGNFDAHTQLDAGSVERCLHGEFDELALAVPEHLRPCGSPRDADGTETMPLE